MKVLVFGLLGYLVAGFQLNSPRKARIIGFGSSTGLSAGEESTSSSTASTFVEDDLASLVTSRLPTSVDDQVRQAVESVKRATADGVHRHFLRLLLPPTGSTELDDWPGGTTQMMEAAYPLMDTVLKGLGAVDTDRILLDADDGVCAVMARAPLAEDDSCTLLLPTADTVATLQRDLEPQVGPKRNLILVNPQWKRRSDFGGVFGSGGDDVDYVEGYSPTFALVNPICEGESIRILRCYPDPFRVFVRKKDAESGEVDWVEVGSKPVTDRKPSGWEDLEKNRKDGGQVFDYGRPSYPEIADMLKASPNYTPKNVAERAAAAFDFFKDSL